MSDTSQRVLFHWQQVDQRLSSILQSKVSEAIRKLIDDDVRHIRFQNMRNSNDMTIPSERLQMHRLRTDEWAARLYEGYCEIWRTQRKPVSPEFRRAIAANVTSVVFSARSGSVKDEFVRELHRTGQNATWLEPALEAFRRDMQMQSHKWGQTAELHATTVQYVLESDPDNFQIKISAWEIIAARARSRTIEAMIASIEARIEMAERALNGMSTGNTPPCQKNSVEQSLNRLKDERKDLRASLDQWQSRLQSSLRDAEDAQANITAAKLAPSTPLDTSEPMEAAMQTRAGRGSPRGKTKRASEGRLRTKTIRIPPYRAEWKRATKALLLNTPNMSVLHICRELDDDAVKMPKKWAAGKNRSFEDAYRDVKLRQRIHTAISKIRADLRKTDVI